MNFMKGFAFTTRLIWGEFGKFNLTQEEMEYKVPLYLIMGRHDRIVHDLAEQYFNMINAPMKELLIFEHSGHLACFEEAEKFNRIMIDKVLNG